MVDVTEMSSKEFDEAFEEHMNRELSENWRKFKDVLLNDSYLPHVLLERRVNVQCLEAYLKSNMSGWE